VFGFGKQSIKLAKTVHPLATQTSDLQLKSTLTLVNKWFSGEAHYTSGQKKPGDPLVDARANDRPLWFVAGYGISRALPDSTFTPTMENPSTERLKPLFLPNMGLVSTAFANFFHQKDLASGNDVGTTARAYAKLLKQAFDFTKGELLPDIADLELRGSGGAKKAADLVDRDRFSQRFGGAAPQMIPAVALSHGYQSTIAWISDLIGHVLLESDEPVQSDKIEGLVLLDEIDLYLHPKWQATFISALRRIFPNVQFVATTHSPVVLAGLAPHEVVRLIVDEKSGDVVRGGWDSETGEVVPTTESEPIQPDPRPMTGTELYETWFGLDRLTPNPHGEALRRYLVLAGDPERSAAREAEFKKLRDELKEAKMMEGLPTPVGGKRRQK
jgi:hypothetical protein